MPLSRGGQGGADSPSCWDWPSSGSSRAGLGEGGAGLVGSRVGVRWGMVGRRQRVRMEGEPLEQGDQTGNVALPAAAGGGEGLWRQDREPGRRVLRCARREMGAGPWGASGGVARG